jgi:hypothetical protein
MGKKDRLGADEIVVRKPSRKKEGSQLRHNKKLVLQENKTQVQLMRNTVEPGSNGFFNVHQFN